MYMHTACWIKMPHSHSVIFFPLLFFSHSFFFPSLPPLSSSLVPLTTTTLMIHVMNHRQIFEGFSPHISLSLFPLLSLSLRLYFTRSPSPSVTLVLRLAFLSLFQSFSLRQAGFVSAPYQRERGTKIWEGILTNLYHRSTFFPLNSNIILRCWL